MPPSTGTSEVLDPRQQRVGGPPADAGGRPATRRCDPGAGIGGPDTRPRSRTTGSTGDILQAVVVVMVLLKLLLFGL